jgi:DNA-binding NarL/FixJ family response regulator
VTKIRVLLADDHAILREGVRALLGYFPDVEVVGEAQDGAEAVSLVAELQPDIVLMDIAMPGMNGIEATGLIHQQHPNTRVLILTQHEDWRYVLPLLQAGASGYVLKRAVGADLISALRTVSRGETFLYPAVATVIVEEIHRQAESPAPATEALTPREKEILVHVAQGETGPQTAAALSLSVKTVEWHRANLMNKLDAHTTADLVRYAIRHGLVQNSGQKAASKDAPKDTP